VSGRLPGRVTVLGPQRRPTVGAVIRTLQIDGSLDGPLAMVTAGWQEREPDDGELRALIGGHGINLGLYGRWLDVLDRDREYAAAVREHDSVLDELHQLYVVQLDAALTALYTVIGRADARPRVKAAVRADAETALRLVDERHLERVVRAREAFQAAWRPVERPVIAQHIADVGHALSQTAGLVLTGGHVAVLLHLLRLFHVVPSIPATVIAWSAGAMALTERVLLFHDRAAQGPAHPEFHDRGLGVIPGLVLLPHARRRLLVDDHTRMTVLAHRCAPARCVVLDDGMRLDLPPDGTMPPGARVVAPDGRIVELAPT
jgi:hypothetical protein